MRSVVEGIKRCKATVVVGNPERLPRDNTNPPWIQKVGVDMGYGGVRVGHQWGQFVAVGLRMNGRQEQDTEAYQSAQEFGQALHDKRLLLIELRQP